MVPVSQRARWAAGSHLPWEALQEEVIRSQRELVPPLGWAVPWGSPAGWGVLPGVVGP